MIPPSCQFIPTCILRVKTFWQHPKWRVAIVQPDYMGRWVINVGNCRWVGQNVCRKEGSGVMGSTSQVDLQNNLCWQVKMYFILKYVWLNLRLILSRASLYQWSSIILNDKVVRKGISHYYQVTFTFDMTIRPNTEYKYPLSFSYTTVVTIICVN